MEFGRTVVTAVKPGSPAALQCPMLEPGMVLVAVDAEQICSAISRRSLSTSTAACMLDWRAPRFC
jgi:hypothetical protein